MCRSQGLIVLVVDFLHGCESGAFPCVVPRLCWRSPSRWSSLRPPRQPSAIRPTTSGSRTAPCSRPREAPIGSISVACSRTWRADTGILGAWNPDADGAVSSIAVAGGVVYLGGALTQLHASSTPIPRSHVAAVTTTGTVTDWNPSATPSGPLATFGSSVFMAGSFPGPTGAEAVDATTAALRPPAIAVAAGGVDGLAADGATLFLGGTFAAVKRRRGVAAITADGRRTAQPRRPGARRRRCEGPASRSCA
jgi:hypothetical protein